MFLHLNNRFDVREAVKNRATYKNMTIKAIKPSQTQITLANGTMIFVSYSTPVAAIIDGKAYRTSFRHSVTTSKHTNKWLGQMACGSAEEKHQSFFDSLI